MPWSKSNKINITNSGQPGTNPSNMGGEQTMDDDREEDWKDWGALIRKCFAEFLGDLIFVFVGSLSFQIGSGGLPINAAFAHGFTIALLIMGMGHISGGHFNPAVTLGVLISNNIHIVHAVCYWFSQLLGGFVGGLFVRAVLHYAEYVAIAGGTTNMNILRSNPGMAIVTEVIITYVLVHSVLMTAVDTSSNVLAPLAIGLSVLVGIFSGGNNSGGSMNPARSFGAAAAYSIFSPNCTSGLYGSSCMDADGVWKYHYVHWVGPAIGAAIAGLFYRLLLARDSRRWLFR